MWKVWSVLPGQRAYRDSYAGVEADAGQGEVVLLRGPPELAGELLARHSDPDEHVAGSPTSGLHVGNDSTGML